MTWYCQGLPGEGTCTSDSDCHMSTYNYCGTDNCHNSAVFSEQTIFRNLLTLESTDRFRIRFFLNCQAQSPNP